MELFEELVNETVNSGVDPIVITFTRICDGFSERAIAYRGETEIFTSESGVISAETLKGLDYKPSGVTLFLRALKKVIRVVEEIKDEDNAPAFLSINAPIALLFENDLYEKLKKILDKEGLKNPEKICLEFTPDILKRQDEKLTSGIKDVFALGFKIAINGFGERDFPVAALFETKVDLVYINEKTTALLTDRSNSGAAMNFLMFVRSMGIETVAEGVADDDTMRQLQKAESFGVIPAKNYEGEFNFDFSPLHCDDIVELVRSGY